jgi:elongation factor Ts
MITAKSVKELREMTGAGMMDCKKALVECDGDIDKAGDWLREKGITKAAKKADRIAAEGLTTVVTEGNYALICEVNSETDFVAKNEKFITFVNDVAKAALNARATTLEEALNAQLNDGTVSDAIVSNTATIGEKLSLRRVNLLEKSDNDSFGSYLHMGGKIGALCVVANTTDAAVAKDVAMHIAASAPQYTNTTDIPVSEVERELHIQTEAAKNDEKLKDKPEAALTKILEGKINKWKAEISLVEQAFIKDPGLSVGKYVAKSGGTVSTFVRYAVGEGMQKREDNFAEEVMNQVGK